jgi:O-antigen/teichoic acid export membrane protein
MFETKEMKHSSLFSGRLFVRNTIYNLLGQAAPLLVALFAIPSLIKGLGTDRFGVLALLWVVIGYFGLFDLGIGRATTKFASEHIAKGEEGELHDVVWSSLIVLLVFGFLGGLLLAALNTLLVARMLHIPPALQDETHRAFYVLAASIPFILGAAGTRGVLEAQQRFGLINAIKIPVSTALLAAPLIILPFSSSLFPISLVLLGSRLLEFVANLLACLKAMPGLRYPRWPTTTSLKRLLGFGSWLTVTNIIGPFMTYMDRFIIGSLLTMSAVAYYTTSYDVITKLGIIPAGLLGVVFPSLSAYAAGDAVRFAALYEKSVKYIIVISAPLVLVLIVWAEPLMDIWLGHEFATQASVAVQILAIGVLVNSVAQGPFAAIQAMGRPDITAKLHALELPFYLGMLGIVVARWGIVGAASAWLIRIVIDTVLLFWLAERLRPARRTGPFFIFLLATVGMISVSTYVSARILSGGIAKLMFTGCGLSALAVLFWRFLPPGTEESADPALPLRILPNESAETGGNPGKAERNV